MKKPRWTSTFVPASILTSAIFCTLLVLAYFLNKDAAEVALTGIICITGYVLGIPIGMAASPYKAEGSHFKSIGGLVTSFVSGLIASKLAELDFKEMLLSSSLQSGRAMLFLAFSVLGMVQTFMFRRYFDASRIHDGYSPEQAKEVNKNPEL